MQTLGIIPSRFASTRFPGKPLVEIDGQSMIQRVYTQACKAKSLAKVIVATDDERIFNHVQSFGGQVMMTLMHHQSGTDRCAEVAMNFQDMEAIINIQGDEPFINPSQIDQVVQHLQQNKAINIATLAKRITDSTQLFSPNIVKVVFNQSNVAQYFSRNAIPFLRGVEQSDWISKGVFYKHIGLYAYRRQTLLKITQLPLSLLEKTESLEQLRWLDNGYQIGIGLTEIETVGIDSPEDLDKVRPYFL